MILALHEDTKSNTIKYAKIGNNLNNLEHGAMNWEDLDGADFFNVSKVVLDDHASQKLRDKVEESLAERDTAIELIDRSQALLSANWLNLENEDLKAIDFPHLAFVDEENETSLYLVSSPTNIKKISGLEKENLHTLLKDLEEMLEVNDLHESAQIGDELTHQFDLEKNDTNKEPFYGLKNFFDRAKETFTKIPKKRSGDSTVDNELKRIENADFAASFQDALAKQLMYGIFETAGETGISLITLGGNFSKNPRFRELAVRLAHEVNYDVRFPELEHYNNPAIAIAARAHLNEFNEIF